MWCHVFIGKKDAEADVDSKGADALCISPTAAYEGVEVVTQGSAASGAGRTGQMDTPPPRAPPPCTFTYRSSRLL